MTATAAGLRSELYDGQGDKLLPIGSFGAAFFVFGALVYSFNVTGFDLLPTRTPLALLVGAFGVLLLTPRLVLHRLPISILMLALVGWMSLSYAWSDDQESTASALEGQLPLLIGMVVCVGVVSLKDLVTALLWTIRFSVGLTVIALIIYPETRLHFDVVTGEPSIPGWHGLFPHKNIMTPFLVMGIVTVLTFDRNRVVKYATLAAIGGLLVGSASVTGMSSAFLAVSVWVWLQLYKNIDVRNSSIFLASSLAVGLFAILGALASLATLTSSSGKDLTFTGRTLIWSATLRAWGERPLQGWGLGGILSSGPERARSERTAEIWREIGFAVPHAHSGAIDLGLQLGAIGLGLFLALYITTMIDAVRVIRVRPKVGAWIVSVLVVQLYMSFSENVFLGTGWLPILLMFRTVLHRRHGMELETGTELVDHVRANIDADGRWVRS